MLNKQANIFKSKILRSVLVIITGTLGGQVIGFLLIPIITRLYGPELYGIWGVFISLVSMLTPLITLSYSNAIVLPKDEGEAISLMQVSIFIASLFSIILFIVFFLFSNKILYFLNIEVLTNYLVILPLLMLLIALREIMQSYLLRIKEFKIVSFSSFNQSLFTYGGQALVGKFYPSIFSLILFYGVGFFVNILIFLYSKKLSLKFLYLIKSNNYRNLLIKYKDFPLYRAPQIFFNSLSYSFPVLILTSMFGVKAAGFYTLTRTVLSLPVTLIGNSVQSVFYPHFNDLILKKKESYTLLRKSTLNIAIFSFIPFSIIFLYGPEIFSIGFGEAWSEAGEYAKWLSILLYSTLFNKPAISIIPILSLQKWFLVYEIITLGVKLSGLFLGFLIYNSPLIAIAIFSITGFILSFILNRKVFHTLKVKESTEEVGSV